MLTQTQTCIYSEISYAAIHSKLCMSLCRLNMSVGGQMVYIIIAAPISLI